MEGVDPKFLTCIFHWSCTQKLPDPKTSFNICVYFAASLALKHESNIGRFYGIQLLYLLFLLCYVHEHLLKLSCFILCLVLTY